MTTNLEHLENKSHPPFGVTADIAVFTIRDERFQLLLIERGEIPFLGRLALPGGFLHPDESAEQAAQRELLEETALDAEIGHLEQLRTYSTPDRDPRENRVVTVAFWAILPDLGEVRGGTDAARALWVPVDELENDIGCIQAPMATWPSTTTRSSPTPSNVPAPSSSTRPSPHTSAGPSSR